MARRSRPNSLPVVNHNYVTHTRVLHIHFPCKRRPISLLRDPPPRSSNTPPRYWSVTSSQPLFNSPTHTTSLMCWYRKAISAGFQSCPIQSLYTQINGVRQSLSGRQSKWAIRPAPLSDGRLCRLFVRHCIFIKLKSKK